MAAMTDWGSCVMNTYIALFRTINVAGYNQLPMKELVYLLEIMGLCNVRTYIQCSNAVLDSMSKDAAALRNSVCLN